MQIGERREVGRVNPRSRRQTIEPSIHDNFSAPTRGRCEKRPTEICDCSKREIGKIVDREKFENDKFKKLTISRISKSCRKWNPVSSAHGLQSLGRSRSCSSNHRAPRLTSRRPLRGACGDLDRRSRSRPRHWRAGSAEQCLHASPQNRIMSKGKQVGGPAAPGRASTNDAA